MMICCNALTQANPRPLEGVRLLLSVLNPFAPHLTEELWDRLATAFPAVHVNPAHSSRRHVADVRSCVASRGRDRIAHSGEWQGAHPPRRQQGRHTPAGRIRCPRSTSRIAHLEGKTVRKVVVVPGRMVNIVVG
jgi:leucyl-tRNA synthetase